MAKKLRENVVEKCGEVIEKKLDKKCAGQKISLFFFNDNRSDFQSDEECSWECCCEMIDSQEINYEFTEN